MKKSTLNLLGFLKNYINSVTIVITFFGFQTQAAILDTNSKSELLVETNRVWINVTDTNGAFSQTLMGYRDGATDGVDNGLDGAYMNNGAVALATLIDGVRYAIQFKGLPFSATNAVPLSFSASYAGNYTFAIDHMDGFFNNSNLPIYIHDTVTNTYNDLKISSYTFTAPIGINNNRFELIYAQPSNVLGNNQNIFTASNLAVYQKNDNVVIDAGVTLLKSVALYSINGQLLYQNSQVNASLTTITTVSLNNQYVIIKAITLEGSVVSKKWLCL
ncbi:hypothetical protein [Flavobacterium sp.]|uniref:hypothetical protein n=1 Tax=Flavobacterium sp. TaxID=239 RepID=UPI0024878691|nr:hypothetical protein [Flavobacterium sp.]MDI1315955.1 hypothetical protein [Flavobacterium sp.]